jgi:hypothetical protein
MKKSMMGFALGVFFVGTAPSYAGQVEGTNFPEYESCVKIVTHRLQEYSLKYDELTETNWRVDYFGRASDDNVQNIHFQGRPKSCSDGHITVKMFDTEPCSIKEVYTTGDCKIKGLKQAWW